MDRGKESFLKPTCLDQLWCGESPAVDRLVSGFVAPASSGRQAELSGVSELSDARPRSDAAEAEALLVASCCFYF